MRDGLATYAAGGAEKTKYTQSRCTKAKGPIEEGDICAEKTTRRQGGFEAAVASGQPCPFDLRLA